MKLTHLLAALALLPFALADTAAATTVEFSAPAHGAIADGTTLNTAALQRAIDAAHAAGGGTVRLTPGTYLTGSLELRSGVTLHLEKGATLLGSPRLADYRRAAKWPALLFAVDQHDIALTGEGVIDGNGRAVAADSVRIFEENRLTEFFPGVTPGQLVNLGGDTTTGRVIDPHALHAEGKLAAIVAPRSRADMKTWRVDEVVRPQLIEFSQCRAVRVEGLTLQHAANWVQTYRMCTDLTITGIRVDSTTYWNNDGLDLVNCQRVRIADCDINAADDGICLKSEPNDAGLGCEDILIERCRLRTSASAVKFGTASHHAFRRITIRDITVRDTYRSAIALESVDGASIEDITVERVTARNTGNAFFLRLGHRNLAKPPGVLRRVVLSEIDVEVPAGKPDAGYPHEGPPPRTVYNLLPASIVGLADHAIEDITLRNIRVTYGGGADRTRAEIPLDALDRVPENRAGYPEFNMFGELPAWALFVRDAKNVRLDNVTFQLAQPDFRAALVAHRVDGLTLTEVTFQGASGTPTIGLVATEGVSVGRVNYPAGTPETERKLTLP